MTTAHGILHMVVLRFGRFRTSLLLEPRCRVDEHLESRQQICGKVESRPKGVQEVNNMAF